MATLGSPKGLLHKLLEQGDLTIHSSSMPMNSWLKRAFDIVGAFLFVLIFLSILVIGTVANQGYRSFM